MVNDVEPKLFEYELYPEEQAGFPVFLHPELFNGIQDAFQGVWPGIYFQ